jgi:hypothetical protein
MFFDKISQEFDEMITMCEFFEALIEREVSFIHSHTRSLSTSISTKKTTNVNKKSPRF